MSEPDQLGTLPPGTLCLLLYPGFPYFPGIVLSRSQAHKQKVPAVAEKVVALESGTIIGACVRFFGVRTCYVLSASDIEPFIVDAEGSSIYKDWIWESSVAKQKNMGWAPFDKDTKGIWNRAFDEAQKYAFDMFTRSPGAHPVPRMARENVGYTSAADTSPGSLPCGTVVWTILEEYPIWPAYVVGLSEDQLEAYEGRPSPDETEPLMFVNDPSCKEPLFSNMDALMGFSVSIPGWIEHMRERSLVEMERNGWKKPTKRLWQQWEKACVEAIKMCEG